jgi:hypothetical protein
VVVHETQGRQDHAHDEKRRALGPAFAGQLELAVQFVMDAVLPENAVDTEGRKAQPERDRSGSGTPHLDCQDHGLARMPFAHNASQSP